MTKMIERDKRKKALELMIGLTQRDSDYMSANRDNKYVEIFFKNYTHIANNGLSQIPLKMVVGALKQIRKDYGIDKITNLISK